MMNSYPNNNEVDERQHLLGTQSNAEHTDYGVATSVMNLASDSHDERNKMHLIRSNRIIDLFQL